MKLVGLFIALFSCLICGKVAYLASLDAREANATADELRNQLEAAWRMQGNVSQAYVCRPAGEE